MANHSKARTEAEAKLKKTQKAQRATEGSQAMSEWPLVMPFVQRRRG